jgi:hypothetical protein
VQLACGHAALPGQRGPASIGGAELQDAARRGLAGNSVHDEGRRSQHGRVGNDGADCGHGNAGASRDRHHARFPADAAGQALGRAVHAQHEFQVRGAGPDGPELPDIARRAAGHPAQAGHRDLVPVLFGKDGCQAPPELSGISRAHDACSLSQVAGPAGSFLSSTLRTLLVTVFGSSGRNSR